MAYQNNPYGTSRGGPRSNYQQHNPVINRNNEIDIRSALAKELYAQGKDYEEPQYQGVIYKSGCEPSSGSKDSAGFEDAEIYFDSVNSKITANLKVGEITFDISGVNANQDVSSFVQMKIESAWFPIPLFSIDPTLPSPFFFRTVFMQILNIPDVQAVKAYNSNRFQFEFDVEELNSVAVKLIPKKDTVYLTRPMIGLSELQCRFTYPPNFKRIPLPKTVINAVSLGESAPGLFRLSDADDLTTEIFGPIGIPTPPGYAVYGFGYNSVLKPSQNPIVNNPQGAFVTEILDNKTFEIATTDFMGAGDALPTTFIVAKNRIAFSIRFTSVKNLQTNYLAGVHF